MRDRLLEQLRALLLPERAIGRCGPATDPDRVFGGTALADSLFAGRAIGRAGLVEELAGGVMLVSAASRIPAFAARLLAAVDRTPLVLVMLADGREEGDGAAAGGVPVDRLPLRLRFDDAVLPPDLPDDAAGRVRRAAELFGVSGPSDDDDEGLAALCEAAFRCGIASLRAPMAAWRAARVLAALDGRNRVSAADIALAARLMLPPWAGEPAGEPAAPPHDPATAPAPPTAEPDAPPEPQPDDAVAGDGAARDPDGPDDAAAGGESASVVLDAIRAALPPGLLDRLPDGAVSARAAGAGGRNAAASRAAVVRTGRGRIAGIRAGRPPGDGRLALFATLCAALPWQKLRAGSPAGDCVSARLRLRLRPSDLRVRRTVSAPRRVTILVVDASGSAARERLREAKGAAELLLAECYRRRDRVALVAFRDRGAALVVPPTGSLVLARRRLLGLPAGGGTPLAAGLRDAAALAERIVREGCTPILVVLTDARGNVALDGSADRSRAEQDALAVARIVAARGWPSLLIDISPRPDSGPASRAARLAASLRGTLVPLPRGRADAVATLAREVGGGR